MNTNNIKKNIQIKKKGRIIAFQTLYSYDVDSNTQKTLNDLLTFTWLDEDFSQDVLDYATTIIRGTLDKLNEIDAKIAATLENWNFDRVSKVDKAILRFSTFSILTNETPSKVVINEAIEIAKKFSEKDSYKFINGILDAIKKTKEAGK